MDNLLEEKPEENYQCYQLKYYSIYFDLDTAILCNRLCRSIFPFRSDSFFGARRPDLWGPFWVVTSLICIMWVVANAQLIYYDISDYSITLLLQIAFSLYIYLFLVPLLTYCFLFTSGVHITYLHLFSIYGYSFTVYSLSIMGCLFTDSLWRWVLTSVAGLWSCLALLKNLMNEFSETCGKILVLLTLGISQVALVVVTNLVFLNPSKLIV